MKGGSTSTNLTEAFDSKSKHPGSSHDVPGWVSVAEATATRAMKRTEQTFMVRL